MEVVSHHLLVVHHAAALSLVAVAQPLVVVHHAAAVSQVVHHAAAVSQVVVCRVAVRHVAGHREAVVHHAVVGQRPAVGHHAAAAFLVAADHAVVLSLPVEHLLAAFSLVRAVAHVGHSPSLAPFSPPPWQPAPPPASVTARLEHLSSLDEAVGRVEVACVL